MSIINHNHQQLINKILLSILKDGISLLGLMKKQKGKLWKKMEYKKIIWMNKKILEIRLIELSDFLLFLYLIELNI